MMVNGKTIHGLVALSIALGACGGDGEQSSISEGSGIESITAGLDGGDTGDTDGGDGTTDDGAADDGSDGGVKLDVGPDSQPEDEECAELSEQAEPVPVPADIIVVVDNSGSMSFEASEVQARLNDFSAQIIASGVDVRVVLISSYPDEGNGICIDPPLGGGGCPDADDAPPLFTHVDRKVSSHDAWEQLLDTHAEWSGVVRPEAIKHVVVVTDDTSDLEVQEFTDGLAALQPGMMPIVHHSVVCHSDCESAAGIGERYIDLSTQTGGVAADLCNQDFQAVFDALTTEVIGGSTLSCEFELPTLPGGMELDPNEVNVELHDEMGGVHPIGWVESLEDCDAVADGWYYDDPNAPTMIIMCPQTCDSFQDAGAASVQIELGCATVPAG